MCSDVATGRDLIVDQTTSPRLQGMLKDAENHAKAMEEAMKAHEAEVKAHQETTKAASASAEASTEALSAAFSGLGMTGSEDYLKNVGSYVAAALDPLGIDVKIDIETPEGRHAGERLRGD